jgi:hypothetical protein
VSKMKPVVANADHQAFFEAMVDLGQKYHLRDEEMVAIMGRLMGYHIASNPDANTKTHLLETFGHNMTMASAEYASTKARPN